MRKQNETERKNTQKSVLITLWFYWFALLVYSIFHVVNTGELGIPFIILMTGLIIFFGSYSLRKGN